MIFGFEGMTNAFRDVNAVSAASRHTPFGRDCVAYTSIRINAPVCKHPGHKFIKRKNRRFFYSSPIGESIFLDSSMVEHSAVNRVVVGSSPTRGASDNGCVLKRVRSRCFVVAFFTNCMKVLSKAILQINQKR